MGEYTHRTKCGVIFTRTGRSLRQPFLPYMKARIVQCDIVVRHRAAADAEIHFPFDAATEVAGVTMAQGKESNADNDGKSEHDFARQQDAFHKLGPISAAFATTAFEQRVAILLGCPIGQANGLTMLRDVEVGVWVTTIHF